jgi:hypothetical protein
MCCRPVICISIYMRSCRRQGEHPFPIEKNSMIDVESLIFQLRKCLLIIRQVVEVRYLFAQQGFVFKIPYLDPRKLIDKSVEVVSMAGCRS